jgi:membrane protein DedA with SNARE-associated domain
MEKLLKAGIWVFIGMALVFFWFSIRSSTDQLQYSITALVLWAIGMLFNYLLKKEREKNDSTDG